MTPELEDYILAHIDPEPEALSRVDRESNLRLVNGRMCSGHLQGRLLKMLVRLTGARRVLELGTFSGYSALCLAEGLPADGELHSIEIDDELEDFILFNWSGDPRMHLHIGDAEEIMPRWPDGHFDLIFVDADKRRYPRYYAEALRLLRPGGLMIADNTLWSGHIADPAYDRDAQTRALRSFNQTVASDPRVEKVILPVRDGITLIYKKP